MTRTQSPKLSGTLAAFTLASALAALNACGDAQGSAHVAGAAIGKEFVLEATPAATRPDGWDAYWYAGLAEVNSYDVQQERYGELRPATEVLIFVTEPFLPDAQVKDDGRPSKEEAISVLKLNRVEKFTTGIYDYSLMLSAFTPVSADRYPHTLKTTFSAQDWCGQVWQQTNRRGDEFRIDLRSYFQSEGDASYSLDADYLEDELLNRVRLDTATVPTGTLSLVPAAKFGRLRHVAPAAERATVSFGESPTAPGKLQLDIEYAGLDRQVAYLFEADFPHKLLGWQETYKGTTLSTGTLKHSRQEPYWSQNGRRFDALRDTLGI